MESGHHCVDHKNQDFSKFEWVIDSRGNPEWRIIVRKGFSMGIVSKATSSFNRGETQNKRKRTQSKVMPQMEECKLEQNRGLEEFYHQQLLQQQQQTILALNQQQFAPQQCGSSGQNAPKTSSQPSTLDPITKATLRQFGFQ